MSFWGELKRRNVFKVGIAYIIAAWLIVQVANTFFPILHLPEWAVTLVAALLILGLPVALILAWAYELTPEGVKLTKKVPLSDSITHVTGRKLNYILTGLLIVAGGYIVVLQFFIGKPPVQTEVVSTVAEQTPVATEAIEVKESPKTIAVLPFENLSSDPEQEYFVDGLSEELLNCLAKIDGLKVTSRTSSFYFKDTHKKLQEIANDLGVEHILEGSVRKAGNELRVAAQLIRAADDAHLWSETYNRKLEDVFAVQEDIAKTVANELKVTLGIGTSFKQLGGTDNVEAYELYLIAKGIEAWTTDTNVLKRFLTSIDAAIAIDPKFALAWAAKAQGHTLLSAHGPANRAVSEQDAALNAAQWAIELEPKLDDAYYQLGWIKSVKGDFINAELAYRKALELQTEILPDSKISLAVHYQTVGYLKRAHELLEEMLKRDPLKPDARGHYMLSLAYLGDTQGAEEEYKHGMALFGDQWTMGNSAITHIRLGMVGSISSDKILSSEPIHVAIKKHLGSPKEGLAELRRLYNDDSSDFVHISMWAAYFGDPRFAMDAMEKWFINKKAAGSFFWFWLPVMKEVRQLPRFKELLKEIGLVDYWNEFGWPDLCRPTDDGDFVCD